MLIECKKCGAPLDVKGDERVTRCVYCGTSTKLRETRTIAAQTPAEWKPPQVWTPPAQSRARSKPMRYRRRLMPAGCSGCGAIVPLIVVGVSALFSLQMSGTIHIPFFDPAWRWDGRSTLECGLNEEIVIDDKQADVTDGPVVRATGPNCHVTIRNSRLRGSEIVRGDMNTEVTIENSTVEATYDGIVGDVNMVVRVLGPSTVVAGGDAIHGGTNLRAEVRGATIRAGGTAISGDVNPHVTVQQGHVEGTEAAIVLRQNAEVDIAASEIVGQTSYGANADVRER